eukprot:80391-Prymnesium_polylepis.1
MPHECSPRSLQRTCTTHRVIPPPHSPGARYTPAASPVPAPSPAPRPPLPVCAQSRPRDDPGVRGCPVPGGCVRGGTGPHRLAAQR